MLLKATKIQSPRNFMFKTVTQNHNENLIAFCNRVIKETKHSYFKCTCITCTAEDTAVRYHILTGKTYGKLRQEALK